MWLDFHGYLSTFQNVKSVIFRGDAEFADELTVMGAFDVNSAFVVSTLEALSGITTIGSSGLATLGQFHWIPRLLLLMV